MGKLRNAPTRKISGILVKTEKFGTEKKNGKYWTKVLLLYVYQNTKKNYNFT
jgi:hypothetical protein